MILATLAGCSPKPPEQEIEFRVPVFVREVETGLVEDRIEATGSLRAPETVVLRTETGGILEIARAPGGRHLSEGDHVEAGTTIAEVTGEEVRLAARSEATSQRYQTVRRDFESKKALYDDGLLSEQEFRQIESQLAEAKIDYEQSQLTEMRSRLVTPISGTILRLARDAQSLPLASGQLVLMGFEVAQIGPTDALIADVDLIGPDVARVRGGLEARVYHHGQDQVFAGRVVRLAPALDPLTRTLRAEVAIDNASGREVTLGLGDDDVVEIRQGLEPGERIVVRGIETLTDGTRVRVSGA
jgi:multidrug efflux system membrane fusion protein